MYIHKEGMYINTFMAASTNGLIILFAAVLVQILAPTLFRGVIIPWAIILACVISLLYIYKNIGNDCAISPITWFLIACAIYYGVGPLIFIYGNAQSIEYINYFYPVTEQMYAKTNVLNGISICLVLTFIIISLQYKFKRLPALRTSDQELIKYAKYISLIGVAFVILTVYLRINGGDKYVMPGIFYILRDFKNAGLFLYGLLFFRGHKSITKYFVLMLVFDGIVAMVSLMKQEIIEYFLMIFFAFILSKKRKLYSTIFFALIILLSYQPMTKVTSVLRNVFWKDNSSLITDKSDNAKENSYNKFKEKLNENTIDERQLTWIRINYTSQQAFAMEQYELGLPGKSFETAKWAFVPRIIYPDKPIITLGEEFTKLVTGRENVGGGTGAGAFAEGYWNKGWLGVIVVCSILGFLLSAATQFSVAVISSNAFQYYPLTVILLKLGYRVDDWFIATSVNSIPMLIFSLVVIISIKKIKDS